MKSIKIFIVIISACFIACIIILAFLLGGTNEILCPVQSDIHYICDVSIDCCCPTETPTPTETVVPFGTPTVTSFLPSHTPTATRVRRSPTATITKRSTSTRAVSSTPTNTVAPPTKTPAVPTTAVPNTPTDVPTVTPAIPTATSKPCVWVCHKPGTSAEQDYCCDSQECVDAHLKHGDYLGKCVED